MQLKTICASLILLSSFCLSPAQYQIKPDPNAALLSWIDKLAWAESRNDDTIVHLDSNSRFSYSCLQFQAKTFINEVKHFNLLPGAEDKEIMNEIMDCDFQKHLALLMLKENWGAWTNWTNSTKFSGIGYPPKNEPQT